MGTQPSDPLNFSMSISFVGLRNSFWVSGYKRFQEFRPILEQDPGLWHRLPLNNLVSMQIKPEYMQRELLHAPTANQDWDLKHHLHSTALQALHPHGSEA